MQIIRNLRVATRLYLMLGVLIVGLGVVLAWTLNAKYEAILAEKRLATQHAVEVAHSVIIAIDRRVADGILTRDQAMREAIATLKAMRYGNDEYFWINDLQPAMVMHPFSPQLEGKDVAGIRDANGKALFIQFVDVVNRDGAGYVDYLWPRPGAARAEPKVSYVKGYAPWGWVVGSGVYVADRWTGFKADLRQSMLFCTGVALVLCVIITLLIRSIVRPLRTAVTVANTIADGDLTQRIETRSHDETGQLLIALARMNERLAMVIGHIREATDQVAIGSQEIAQGNADLSQRTEEQASSLEETASSMEELTSTVKQNADNARQANQLAASASEVAAKGGAVVGEVVSTMSSISASSKKIADIISVIDGIAFQTNILALNAAVEAARAGEQGRGFAVVASEVRNLAQRSAGAAKEIKELITDSVGKVDSGTKLVADAGNTMAEVVASVKRVTDIMAEITAASLEQSSGIEQVNQAIVQMDQVTQQNAALVEESAAAAESMEEQAKQLASAVAVFKLAGRVEAEAAPAPAGAGWDGTERRRPNRAAREGRPIYGSSPISGKRPRLAASRSPLLS